MQHKTRTIAALAVSFAAVLVFIFVLVRAVWYDPDSGIIPPPSLTALPAGALATSSLPVRLLIPSLSVDANVQYVGVKQNGSMGTPDNFTDVAWYKNGAAPGQAGSAVIDGHVDNGLGLDGIFKHLQNLAVGDDVYVRTAGGHTLHFVVYDIEIYPYKNVPMQTVFASSDAAHLNLITCEGAWVPGGDTYDHRIVVYTKLVSS